MFTLAEAAKLIRARELSPAELTRECLERIGKFNPALNAFITVTADLAMNAAQEAEREIMAGSWRGPLHGIPIALKDLIDVEGVRTTAASNQMANNVALMDAAITRQLKAAGAIIVGKTNLQEFAFGGSGIVSPFGAARNPWDLERITGGSSSGSAAAVAAGLCVAAIGTDTAGSVRCPAALCGIVGLRPSMGLLSSQGIIPLSTSFDTAGPMARTATDATLLLGSLLHPRHSHGSDDALGELSSFSATSIANLRIGIGRGAFFEGLDPELQNCVEAAIAVLTDQAAGFVDVEIDVSAPFAIRKAEIYEYHEAMLTQHPELYDPRTLQRLEECQGVSATEYLRAERRLEEDCRRALKIFEDVDVVLTPTAMVPAPSLARLEAMDNKALREYELQFLLKNTLPFSFLRWPSVSVPCGFAADEMPVGLQISSRPGEDFTVLRVARAYESVTDWTRRRPPE